jgi:hypothetical protein
MLDVGYSMPVLLAGSGPVTSTMRLWRNWDWLVLDFTRRRRPESLGVR